MRCGSLVCAVGLAVISSACAKASASSFDPANPLNCASQFESYHILAKRMGDEKSAAHYGFRSQWYAERARSLPKEQLSADALERLGERIASAPDGGLALATECQKRQDADPSFPRVNVNYK